MSLTHTLDSLSIQLWILPENTIPKLLPSVASQILFKAILLFDSWVESVVQQRIVFAPSLDFRRKGEFDSNVGIELRTVLYWV